MRVTAKMRELIGDRLLRRTSAPITNGSDGGFVDFEMLEAGHDTATVVQSLLPDGDHMPVIDLDLECMLVPSSAAGHYHLYINKAMSFGQFLNILQALTDAGVVQEGYNHFTRQRGYATVRYPGVTKQNELARIRKGRKSLSEFDAELDDIF